MKPIVGVDFTKDEVVDAVQIVEDDGAKMPEVLRAKGSLWPGQRLDIEVEGRADPIRKRERQPRQPAIVIPYGVVQHVGGESQAHADDHQRQEAIGDSVFILGKQQSGKDQPIGHSTDGDKLDGTEVKLHAVYTGATKERVAGLSFVLR